MTVDKSSEQWRHECEARYVAHMENDSDRVGYLGGVATHRGKENALKLRLDAWAELQLMRQKNGPEIKRAP